MKRIYFLYIKIGNFLKYIRNILTEFSNNSKIVSSCFTSPILGIQSGTEFSKCIGTEEYFCIGIVSHNDFRPVNHRCCNKCKCMFSKFQCVFFFDYKLVLCIITSKELLHDGKCFRACHNCGIWIILHKYANTCGVIRFHMLNDQIVWFCITEHIFYICKPFFWKMCINGIKNGNFIIRDHIRIVCHTILYLMLSFKKINVMVVHANIFDIFCNSHID